MENKKKAPFMVIIPFLLILSACIPKNDGTDWVNEEYERMIEPTNTTQEITRSYDAESPEIPEDNDGDGWTDDFDLCPGEASREGLAGCQPLQFSTDSIPLTRWYQLPIDPGGRVNVFGDRFLVLTNYELGELQIYDLADGIELRSFQFPDMLNDSPILLPQGILLKNYDQQRWRLVNYNGIELYAANEELEIINQKYNLLVSRADNTVFVRWLNDLNMIKNQIPGRYVTFSNRDFVLAITNPEACTITLLEMNNSQNNQSLLFTPGSAICNQSAQFTGDGQYTFFVEDSYTQLISINNPNEHLTYNGIPLAQYAGGLILLDQNQLKQQFLTDEAGPLLFDAGSDTIQKILLSPDQSIVAVLTRNMETRLAQITFVNLADHTIEKTIQAESMEFGKDNFYAWSFGEQLITFYDLNTYEIIYQLETEPITAVQTALNNSLFLISGQDRQLSVYGPEIK